MSAEPVAYRPAPTGVSTFALNMLVSIGLAAGVYVLTPRFAPGWSPWFFASVVVLAGYGVAMVVGFGLDRRRRERLVRSLAADGLKVNAAPDYVERHRVFTPVRHLDAWLELSEGRPGLRWTASAGDGRTQYFEHMFITGSGDEAAPNGRAVCFATGLAPDQVVSFERAEGRRRKRWLAENPHPLLTGDADFDRDWVSGDPESVRRVLTPRVRALLRGAPPGEAWVLGAGVLTMCYQGFADARAWRVIRARFAAVLAAMDG